MKKKFRADKVKQSNFIIMCIYIVVIFINLFSNNFKPNEFTYVLIILLASNILMMFIVTQSLTINTKTDNLKSYVDYLDSAEDGIKRIITQYTDLKGVDITKRGSGNLGASNTVATIGWLAGALVFIHDFGKAILAVYLAKLIFPNLQYAPELAGVFCVIGHIFPFYLKGKGGKGFASLVGMSMMLDWKFTLCLIVIVLLILFITDYIVLGTFTSMVVIPTYFGIMNHDFIIVLILGIASIVILFKHIDNVIQFDSDISIRWRKNNKRNVRYTIWKYTINIFNK